MYDRYNLPDWCYKSNPEEGAREIDLTGKTLVLEVETSPGAMGSRDKFTFEVLEESAKKKLKVSRKTGHYAVGKNRSTQLMMIFST